MSGDPEPTVRYEVSDGVALLTLNRPDALNAITMEMEALLEERLREADDDADVRCLVITGPAAASVPATMSRCSGTTRRWRRRLPNLPRRRCR